MSPDAPKYRALSTSRPNPSTVDASVAAMTMIVESATPRGERGAPTTVSRGCNALPQNKRSLVRTNAANYGWNSTGDNRKIA